MKYNNGRIKDYIIKKKCFGMMKIKIYAEILINMLGFILKKLKEKLKEIVYVFVAVGESIKNVV